MKRLILCCLLALFGVATIAPDADACGRRRGKVVVKSKTVVGVRGGCSSGGCAGGVCR